MNYKSPLIPILEPAPPPTEILSNPSQDETITFSQLSILQLNCNGSKPVFLQLLSQQHHHILIVQETWVKPHTLLAPTHPSWHVVMPLGFTPSEDDKRQKTCIYLAKTIPTASFTPVPSGSGPLTAVELCDPNVNTLIRLVSLFITPQHRSMVYQCWTTGGRTTTDGASQPS